MNERHVPDDRPGPETEARKNAGDADKGQAKQQVSLSKTPDNDTEGQGGKVFAVDQTDAEQVEPA